jgi:hypothetical protein
MPWLPELFTAPALARIWEDQRRRTSRPEGALET